MVRRIGPRINGVPLPVLFGCTFATIMGLLCSVTYAMGELVHVNVHDKPQLVPPAAEVLNEPYSKAWTAEMLADGDEGECKPVRVIYEWRNVGWGSNMNRILAEWVLNSILRGTNNFAVHVSPRFLRHVNCSSVAAHEVGKTVEGWECFFKPMPRLCTFHNWKEVREFVDNDGLIHEGVPTPDVVSRDLKIVEAAAALLEFIGSNAQPWFATGIEAVLSAGNVVAMRSGRFIALHVRRGDKLRREAKKTEVEVYLQAAAQYLLQSSGNRAGVDSIYGIWVSSDDSSVIPEVQQLASSYFPNVATEAIFGISFRTFSAERTFEGDALPTTSKKMDYELYVGLHAELQMLSEADVFVGTFSSNIGRLVYLMREINGFLRNSTISVDTRDWFLG